MFWLSLATHLPFLAGTTLCSKTALLGAASYAIDLPHPIAAEQLLRLAANPPRVSWLLCMVAAGVIAGRSIPFHLRIEAPLPRWL